MKDYTLEAIRNSAVPEWATIGAIEGCLLSARFDKDYNPLPRIEEIIKVFKESIKGKEVPNEIVDNKE